MKIGIDLDEVVNEFAKIFLEYYNQKNKTHYQFKDMTNPLFWNHLGLSSEAFFEEFKNFENEYKIGEYPLIKDSKISIHKLAKENEIFFITSRSESKRAETLRFLKRHFGKIKFKLTIASNRVNANKGMTKAQICKDLGISIIIDDGPFMAEQCAKEGIFVLLFDNPWNKNKLENKYDNIRRVKNWKEIVKAIDEMKTYIYPKNKEHFKKMIPFTQKILKICKDNGIETVIYGSFSHFYHTKDRKMKVNDIDILVRGKNLDRLVKILKRTDVKFKYYPEWPTLIIKKGDLKIEVDNLGKGYRTMKYNSLPKRVDRIDFYGIGANILTLKDLIEMYPIAYNRSRDDKARILKKIRLLESFLGRKLI